MAENAGTKWRQWVNLEEMGAGVAWEGFPTSNKQQEQVPQRVSGRQPDGRQAAAGAASKDRAAAGNSSM